LVVTTIDPFSEFLAALESYRWRCRGGGKACWSRAWVSGLRSIHQPSST